MNDNMSEITDTRVTNSAPIFAASLLILCFFRKGDQHEQNEKSGVPDTSLLMIGETFWRSHFSGERQTGELYFCEKGVIIRALVLEL
jgi:hypothetical protein